MVTTISRTDLARRTREVIERVRGGQTVIVQSYGGDQIVLLDMLDYRILRAAASHKAGRLTSDESVEPVEATIVDYLNEKISLGKLAELLDVSRFELQDRFVALGVPLRLGPKTIEEAREEIAVARKWRSGR